MPLTFLLTIRRRLVDVILGDAGGVAAAPEVVQARQLLTAIDRGGVPLHPAKVNAIARGLGLEVSSKAPMDETIERIRQALQRAGA